MNSRKMVILSVRYLLKLLDGKKMPLMKHSRFTPPSFTKRFIRFMTFTLFMTFMIFTIKKLMPSLKNLLVQMEAFCSFAKLQFLLPLVQIKGVQRSP